MTIISSWTSKLVNQTKIKYDIDQVRFKIEDKKQDKRTTTQSVEVEPVMSLFDIKEFKKNYRKCLCVQEILIL